MINPDIKPRKGVHPDINRFINENYHYSYSAVHRTLLADPYIREGLENISLISMAPKLRPLLVSRAQNCETAEEIISHQFMESCCENSDSNSNLATCIKSALEKAEFPPGGRVYNIINEQLKKAY